MNYIKDISSEAFDAKCYRDLLPPDSDVWKYIELIDLLDFSAFDEKYSGEGQTPVDPRLIMRTILYGFNHRMTSVRGISNSCLYDMRFIVLSGNLRLDRRTFDRFLIRHDKAIKELFVQVVNVCKQTGLVSFKRIAIDGSRFKAQTNPGGVKYENMDKTIAKLNASLDELKSSDQLDLEEQKEAALKEIATLTSKIENIKAAKKKLKKSTKHKK